jgi:hypothetical protein
MKQRLQSVVRSYQTHGLDGDPMYLIRKNDILKFGREKLKVVELKITSRADNRKRVRRRRAKRNILKKGGENGQERQQDCNQDESSDSDRSINRPLVGEKNYLDPHIPYFLNIRTSQLDRLSR